MWSNVTTAKRVPRTVVINIWVSPISSVKDISDFDVSCCLELALGHVVRELFNSPDSSHELLHRVVVGRRLTKWHYTTLQAYHLAHFAHWGLRRVELEICCSLLPDLLLVIIFIFDSLAPLLKKQSQFVLGVNGIVNCLLPREGVGHWRRWLHCYLFNVFALFRSLSCVLDAHKKVLPNLLLNS